MRKIALEDMLPVTAQEVADKIIEKIDMKMATSDKKTIMNWAAETLKISGIERLGGVLGWPREKIVRDIAAETFWFMDRAIERNKEAKK